MAATFKQKAVNTKERLNVLQSHHHDDHYEKKGTAVGTNLLINGDKSISQRGDFTGAFTASTGEYYVDRCQYNQTAFIGANLSHTAFDVDICSSSVKVEAFQAGLSSSDSFWLRQPLDYPAICAGKTVTYTALVKSNTKAVIQIQSDTGSDVESNEHSGSGEYELLTVTETLPTTITFVDVRVKIAKTTSTAIVAIGEYFEVGNEQLEFGSKFTDFEHVNPVTQLSNCQRYGRLINPFSLVVVEFTGGNEVKTASILFPTMRATPVITLPLSIIVTQFDATSAGAVDTIVLDATKTTMSFIITHATSFTSPYSIFSASNIFLDSEI